MQLKTNARIAGFFYLLVLIFPIIVGVTRGVLISADAQSTANAIVASDWIFRIGILADVGHLVSFLLLAWFLYVLLKPVNKNIALLFLLCVGISVAIQCTNMINYFAALKILMGTEYLTAFNNEQLQALAMFYMVDMQEHGVMVAQIFFGLWLLPLGYVISKSNYIPKIIGTLLMMGCFGYLIDIIQYLLLHGLEVISYPGLAVATVAELSLLGWLLVKGIKTA